MNGRSQMRGSKKLDFGKIINANRFFRDSYWLEIWKNHLCLSMGLNGRSLAMDSEIASCADQDQPLDIRCNQRPITDFLLNRPD
jgi:hypothetical protein